MSLCLALLRLLPYLIELSLLILALLPSVTSLYLWLFFFSSVLGLSFPLCSCKPTPCPPPHMNPANSWRLASPTLYSACLWTLPGTLPEKQRVLRTGVVTNLWICLSLLDALCAPYFAYIAWWFSVSIPKSHLASLEFKHGGKQDGEAHNLDFLLLNLLMYSPIPHHSASKVAQPYLALLSKSLSLRSLSSLRSSSQICLPCCFFLGLVYSQSLVLTKSVPLSFEVRHTLSGG